MLNNQIINWYSFNKRELPWRETKDPYLIWVSEIMLQQTRVATAIDYYHRFTNRFPTVSDLAMADEQEVLNLWQGLGYYSRARNLHHAAKTIHSIYKGIFPDTYKEILQLKGIGSYTAAAISSFAYNLPHAVLDGNVFRVLSRIYGVDTPIDTGKGKKEFENLANETMGKAEPEIYNQAIIEFGALQCTPKNPKCEICPVRENCFAFNNNCIDLLPVKSKQIKTKDRYFYFLFVSCEDSFIIQKREQKDIWLNLYQYPLIEKETEKGLEELIMTEEWKGIIGKSKIEILSQSDEIVHKLTHQNLKTRFIHIECPADYFKNSGKYLLIKKSDWQEYPFPKLIENHIKSWYK
jgi:A/G-specific adenine glycosylase